MFSHKCRSIEKIRLVARDNVIAQVLKVEFAVVGMLRSNFFVQIHEYNKVRNKFGLLQLLLA